MRRALAVLAVGAGLVSSGEARDFGDGVSAIQARDLLSCEMNNEFFRSRCTVEESAFLPRASYRSASGARTPVKLTVAVDYRFPCSGHAVKVGVTSDQEQATFKFNETRLTLQGYGPFTVKDFAPGENGVTYRAALAADCRLEVWSVRWDLAPVSLQKARDQIATAKALRSVRQSAAQLSQTSASLAAVLGSLDPQGVKTVLESLRGEAELLKSRARSLAAQDALSDVLDEIDTVMALNPATTEGEAMRQRARGIFADLDAVVVSLVTEARGKAAAVIADTRAMLDFAADETRERHLTEIEALEAEVQ